MSSAPFWGDVGVKKWSRFFCFGDGSAIFWHLKTGTFAKFHLHITCLAPVQKEASPWVKIWKARFFFSSSSSEIQIPIMSIRFESVTILCSLCIHNQPLLFKLFCLFCPEWLWPVPYPISNEAHAFWLKFCSDFRKAGGGGRLNPKSSYQYTEFSLHVKLNVRC